MVKSATKAPAHNGKPITAFFARSAKGLSSTSQDALPYAKTRSSKKTLSNVESEKSSRNLVATETSNNASKSSGSVSASQRAVERNNDNDASSTSATPTTLTSSLKRMRSPSLLESTLPSASMVVSKLDMGSPEHRKHNKENTSACVNSSTKLNGKKRARLSALEDPLMSELLVPSSQSDEEELVIPSTGPGKSNNDTPSSTPTSSDDDMTDAMDIDNDASDHLLPTSKPLTPTSETFDLEDGQSSGRTTPPPSDLPLMPCTPRPLDPESKTAKIIAEIKRMAYAEVVSSPEAAPLEFDEDLVISSDEDDDIPSLLPPRAVPVTSNRDKSPAIVAEAGNRRSARYALRNRSVSPTGGSCTRIPSDKKSVKTSVPTATARKSQTKKSVADPFAALLKEKRKALKDGGGSDMFTRAEILAQKLANGTLFDDMEEIDGDSDNDAAKALVENPDSFAEELSNLNMEYVKDKEKIATEDEDEDLKTFKAKGGRAILNILKEDKALKYQDESSEKRSGIIFWSSPPNNAFASAKAVDSYELSRTSPIIRLFNSCIRRHDLARAATLLNTDFLYSVKTCDRSSIAAQLYDLVFQFPSAPEFLRDAAFNALEEFWASTEAPSISSILFSQILQTVRGLGADPTVISVHNWPIDNPPQYQNITTSARELALSRLFALIIACARFKRLQIEEIPDIILALVLMGMDAYASSQVLHNVSLAVDLVCNCADQRGANASDVEIRLCSKLLQCAQTYDPTNKTRLISLLSFGSGITRRIANFLAYCIITDKRTVEQEQYSDTPPLPPIIEQLEPYSRSSSCPPGKFALHPKTDYVDLAFFITILGVAVSNLRNYVARERQESAARNSAASRTEGSPKKSVGKVETNLQVLRASLDRLHSDIVDTRATHLDRSRTKGIIKGLALTIHYQREHWVKNDSKTLTEYFPKKSKT